MSNRVIDVKVAYLRRTFRILENLLDIPLNLSDKMELRKYVSEYKSEQDGIDPFTNFHMLQDVSKLSAAKFVLVNYPNVDKDKLFYSIQMVIRSNYLNNYLFEQRKTE